MIEIKLTEKTIGSIKEYRIGNLYWSLIPSDDNLYRVYYNGELKETRISVLNLTDAHNQVGKVISKDIEDILNSIDIHK